MIWEINRRHFAGRVARLRRDVVREDEEDDSEDEDDDDMPEVGHVWRSMCLDTS